MTFTPAERRFIQQQAERERERHLRRTHEASASDEERKADLEQIERLTRLIAKLKSPQAYATN